MANDTQRLHARYDGLTGEELARRLDLPLVHVYGAVASTQDVAHELAQAGALAGTLVIADTQYAGRGRAGRVWTSDAGGIWLTMLERPTDAAALQVLSLRIGLRLAAALDRFAAHLVKVKWPNDLWIEGRKVAGILVEVRWKADRPEWIAIGVGINLTAPAAVAQGTGLSDASDRLSILEEVIPALRGAAAARGAFSHVELARYAERDAVRGRSAIAPGRGRVDGIDADGRVVIVGEAGPMHFGSGSLVLEDSAT